jgi:signal transduction histidine kinase
MLERVSRLAVETLRCDWSLTLLRDDRRKVFELCASAGARAEVVDELRRIDFTSETVPIIGVLRPGELLEIDAATRQMVTPPRLARCDAAAELYAPIGRHGELIAVMVHGHRTPGRLFSPKQRRLALGIAHATAIALENARLIADLQAANRLKSEFVSTMSHELRTPLNVILGFSEMARDTALPLAERDDCVMRVETAARDLLGLIESTLEIGKFEAKGPEIRLEVVSLPALWADLRAGCATLPSKPEVSLDWSMDVPDVALVTDPGKLTIVMRNLVGNALKFTERGWVHARARATDDAIMLEVADTGIGIDPDDHQVIFDMFRQADGSDSRRYGGVGLGLYIVRQLVEQLGGSVAIESSRERGALFTVTFPRPRGGSPVVCAA